MTTYSPEKIRNIAIIAHVDHGKTTLVDALLHQSGAFKGHQKVDERVMDSGDIEKERGITILAKNTAVEYNDHLINIVDTPGHADFGSEVERVLGMVDGAVLLVDSSEGPMPQTKFVLGKALRLGLKPIVLINKMDRSDARPAEVVNEVFDLFDSLGATEEQLDFPILYAVARDGWVSAEEVTSGENCEPLFDLVLKHVPSPESDADAPFTMLATTMERDEYVGRMVTGRIYTGKVKVGQPIKVMDRDGKVLENTKVSKIVAFRGTARTAIDEAVAGDIVSIAGASKVFVSHTVCEPSVNDPLDAMAIDPPTLAMTFGVNSSPLVGQDGDKLTSREIGDRLAREAEVNVGLVIEQGSTAETFRVMGRGELQLAVLIETMRREGFELSVSRPEVIFKEEGGKKLEPYEEVVIDVDTDFAGVVMEKMGLRRAELVNMVADHHGKQRLIFEAPSRGMIGYRSEFLMDTRGTGIITRIFKHYGPVRSQASARRQGVLVSMEAGKAAAFALLNLEDRGVIFVDPGSEVYDGMIIGENARTEDLEVNPIKGKKLTNMRASGKDEAVSLTPPRDITLEYALTYIEDDELVEITPKSIRLRKKGLDTHARKRYKRALESA
ncbi:MAG: translational GTPase TypA [Magnetococcales bacterium]|nr:translational GTPase TypA [Magnetococcales bacterium]